MLLVLLFFISLFLASLSDVLNRSLDVFLIIILFVLSLLQFGYLAIIFFILGIIFSLGLKKFFGFADFLVFFLTLLFINNILLFTCLSFLLLPLFLNYKERSAPFIPPLFIAFLIDFVTLKAA